MFAALRSRLTFSNVVAMLALVFAMSGGAYAFSSHSGGATTKATALAASVRPHAHAAKKKKKSSPKGVPGPRGSAGPAGPVGVAGPAGPAGATGGKGENGTAGTDGTNGTNGTNGENGKAGKPGESVTSKEFSGKEGPCKEGGSEFESEPAKGKVKTYACDGEKGVIHPGETLPPGATETGVWAFRTAAKGEEAAKVPISFPIPLAERLESSNACDEDKGQCPIYYVPWNGVTPAGCFEGTTAGTFEDPKAAPGSLCIYEAQEALEGAKPEPYEFLFKDPEHGEPGSVGTTGGLLQFDVAGPEGSGYGVWAVTASTS
jgi:collagen triple helix repeat protein